jgi:hypothetical protein
MGMLPDGYAVLSFPVTQVRVAAFTASANSIRIELKVEDPCQLSELVRDLAEIRAASEKTRAPRPRR